MGTSLKKKRKKKKKHKEFMNPKLFTKKKKNTKTDGK